MKKLLLTLFLTAFVVLGHAQTALNEIRSDIRRAASNYMAYPGPVQQQLTPAPAGMQPFYLSHYGRHGSRFHTKRSMYYDPYLTLARADSLGKLTPKGRDVLVHLNRIRQDAENRWGDLTTIGAKQLREISHRMYERFPELFQDRADVDARSTSVGRCILSMENALLELLRHNRHLNIHHNATHRDMDYLNLQDKKLMAMKFNKPARTIYKKYTDQLNDCSHLMGVLFNDTAYVNHQVNAAELSLQLLLIASIMQNTELGQEINLYDIFSVDEAYRMWKIGNIRWYIGWGAAPVNGSVQPYTQRNLLRKMLADADSCVYSEQTHVQLRFGHETVLLPLLCLLDVNGLGVTTHEMDRLEDYGWINYQIVPMGANLQLVFYRRNPQDRDVLFKVLLNENEATLPLPTVTPPYYRWSDFREYCLKKLEGYEEKE